MKTRLMVALLVVTTITGSASAAVLINTKEPIETTIDTPCSEDKIYLSGYVHSLVAATEDGNGGFHVKIKSQWNLKGVVVAGPNLDAKYQGKVLLQETNNMKVGETKTIIERMLFIGQGKAPNHILKVIAHATMNANGVVTVKFAKTEIACK